MTPLEDLGNAHEPHDGEDDDDSNAQQERTKLGGHVGDLELPRVLSLSLRSAKGLARH